MALLKEITLDNGVTIRYHRIVSINHITNHVSMIEVASYTSKQKREEEQLALASNQPMNVYIFTEYINKEYTPNLDIEEAYTYLKTLEKYKGATNDIN